MDSTASASDKTGFVTYRVLIETIKIYNTVFFINTVAVFLLKLVYITCLVFFCLDNVIILIMLIDR